MLQVHGNERRSKGTDRVHRRPANGAGEHCFESNHRADGDSCRNAFFFRPSRDVQYRKHEQEGQDKFEDKGLRFGPRGKRCAEKFVLRE